MIISIIGWATVALVGLWLAALGIAKIWLWCLGYRKAKRKRS